MLPANSRKLSLMDKAQRYYRVVIGQGVDFLHATTLTPEEMKSATPRGAEIIELVPLEAALAQRAQPGEDWHGEYDRATGAAQQAQPVMPTRDAIQSAIVKAQASHLYSAPDGDAWRESRIIADAVLALFAPRDSHAD